TVQELKRLNRSTSGTSSDTELAGPRPRLRRAQEQPTIRSAKWAETLTGASTAVSAEACHIPKRYPVPPVETRGIHETNLCFCSRRRGGRGLVRCARACRAGGGASF